MSLTFTEVINDVTCSECLTNWSKGLHWNRHRRWGRLWLAVSLLYKNQCFLWGLHEYSKADRTVSDEAGRERVCLSKADPTKFWALWASKPTGSIKSYFLCVNCLFCWFICLYRDFVCLFYFQETNIFYWSIIALQYCVHFCYTTKWISHMYTYNPLKYSWFIILC